MTELQLTCLGACDIALAGEALTAFATDKVRALLVYLVLEPQVHERSQLAQFFGRGIAMRAPAKACARRSIACVNCCPTARIPLGY
ncbi:MAG: hypothetical protein R2911_41560 [Caldilineaceae bacterium]